MNRRRLAALVALAVGAGATAFALARPPRAPGPCERIVAACEAAGYARRAAATGNGLMPDCVTPLLEGQTAPAAGSRPLPEVARDLIAACLTRAPGFGGARAQAAPSAAPAPALSATAAARAGPAPNVVFVLTDDLAWNLVPYMPRVLAMQKNGVTFTNFFVTDSLCCPSRSSIFTGRYPHDTGVYRNVGKDGGYLAFNARGNERATFAAALAAAGYRTAMLGKYLNGYVPTKHPPAPGWTTWAVAGNAYREFSYALNQDGRIVRYGEQPDDYLTDVLARLGTRFVREAAGAPFLLEIATFAPHAPYVAAPRDAGALAGVTAPRTPAFDAAPDADAPGWLAARDEPLTPAEIAAIDRDFRKRAQSVLAVDALIGALQAAVAAAGAADNTYFVFSSDNGYHMGEHRLMPGKMTAFDTDIRVPLIVTGPGVPRGAVVDEVVANVDLAPTFIELGGAPPPARIDGASLVPFLRGERVADWRTAALVEHRGPNHDGTDPDLPGARSGNPVTYQALRARSWLYVEYADGDREFHDHRSDPHELVNAYATLSARDKAALRAALAAVTGCHDAASCRAAERAAGEALSR